MLEVIVLLLIFYYSWIHNLFGLFNYFFENYQQNEIEIVIDLIRLLLIYLVGTILYSIQFLIVYLFILFSLN